MTFDGTTAKAWLPKDHNAAGDPKGFINALHWWGTIKRRELEPIATAFRGLSPAMTSYPVDRLLRVDRTLSIDGAPCEESVAGITDQAEVHFWLDPKQGYAVRRVRDERKNKTADQLDVRYRQEEAVGWVPVSWVWRRVSAAGDVLTTDTVEVTAMRLNEPQPAGLFNIEFPVGTVVYDQSSNKEHQVQPDGSLIEVVRTARPEPPAEPGRGDPFIRWLVVGIGVLVLAGVSAYGLRRKRQ
jgi:hypothetical protein